MTRFSFDSRQPEPEVEVNFPQTGAEMLVYMAELYKYTLSDFEAVLWQAQIFDRYPNEVVMRALMAHMESGTNDANFMPKYGAIKARLEPVQGFAQIEEAVRRHGPYVVPDIQDPILVGAIEQMGGWARVCQELPDPVARPIDFDRYVKRIEGALQTAKQKVQVLGERPAPLKAIGRPQSQALPAKAAHAQLAAPTRALPSPKPGA